MADPELVIFAEREGKPAGFALGLPNFNEILIGASTAGCSRSVSSSSSSTARRSRGCAPLVFGLMPEYRHTGLSYLLYAEFEKRGVRRGYEWGELSWQLEDNEAVNRFAASIGARLYKRYRIYERRISRPPCDSPPLRRGGGADLWTSGRKPDNIRA